MFRALIFSTLLFTCLSAFADKQAEYAGLKEILLKNGFQLSENTDTVIDFKGYHLKIKQEKDSVIHIGLNLFNQDWKQVIDPDLLDYIERDLLLQIAGAKEADDSMIVFRVGNLADMKSVSPESSCNITAVDNSILSVDWTRANGSHVLISAPISYDVLRGGSRSEIESAFISKLKQEGSQRKVEIEIDATALQPYGESDYILPGEHYINEYITRNIYLYSDNESEFIWDSKHPLESVSNLFICGTGNGDTDVDLTVMKHEYGEKEQLKTSVENLIAIAEKEGCVPFWGLENYENGKVTGSLFLYNPRQGYDHVVKIECVPEEIIAGDGKIIAKAYLFIPSNNVSNINAPYRVKTEDEKIKYWEN